MSRTGFATQTNNGDFQCIYPGKSQKLSVSNTSVQSAQTAAATTVAQFFSTVDCWIAIGQNPTAIAADESSFFLPSGLVLTYGIEPGEKIAVIRDVDDGDLHIIEGSE